MEPKHFRKLAAHHLAKAKLHKAKGKEHSGMEAKHRGLAECFGKMADCAKSTKSEMHNGELDPETLCRAASSAHAALADSHAQHSNSHASDAEEHQQLSEYFEECADAESEKIARDRLGKRDADNALAPTKVRATPPMPGYVRIDLIERGAPEQKPATPNIPHEFQKLFAVE